MVILRIVKRYQCYNPGEVAGFQEAEADRLLGAGIAVQESPVQEEEPPVLATKKQGKK